MIVCLLEPDRPRACSDARREHMRRIRALQDPPRGERNGAAKLTAAQVRKIRALRADGMRPSALALRFGVDRGLIWRILTGRSWGHV